MHSLHLAMLLLVSPLLASHVVAAPPDNDCTFVTNETYYGSMGYHQSYSHTTSLGFDGIQFADLNGDGRADAIAIATDTNGFGMGGNMRITVRYAVTYPEVKFSDTTTFLDVISVYEYYGLMRMFFADVNGDGFADAISIRSTDVLVRLNDGAGGLLSPMPWTTDAFYGTQTFVADVDGDTFVDLVAVSNQQVWVRRSNGSSFDAAQLWLSLRRHSQVGGTHGVAFSDVTGDGRADLIVIDDSAIYVRPAIGSGSSMSFATPATQWTSGAFWGQHGTYFADVTGDGRPDAIAVKSDGIWVKPNNGTSFFGGSNWIVVGPFYGDVKTAFAPLSVTSRADMIFVQSIFVPYTAHVIKARFNMGSWFRMTQCYDV